MTPEQEMHLHRIKAEFAALADAKYRAGVAEHGGNLWEKTDLLEQALWEAVDLVNYLLTEIDRRRGRGCEARDSRQLRIDELEGALRKICKMGDGDYRMWEIANRVLWGGREHE